MPSQKRISQPLTRAHGWTRAKVCIRSLEFLAAGFASLLFVASAGAQGPVRNAAVPSSSIAPLTEPASPPPPPTPPPEAPAHDERPAERLHLAGPRVAFFPPDPPVFRAPIAEPGDRSGPTAPGELEHFVNEYFYGALGTRLREESLNKKLQDRIDAYARRRGALLNELTDRIALLQDADPAVREGELRGFAAAQSQRLAALETEAEQLRDDLVRGPLFQFSVDWNRPRSWVLGTTTFPGDALEKEAEFEVVRAAAFYQPGLIPAQRGLLRELALELDAAAHAARGLYVLHPDNATIIFFSPELARIRLPPDLPPGLTALIARFNGEKAALKRELRDAIIDQDRATPEARAAALDTLGDNQWPRLVALDELAEEIRRGLAALPPPPPLSAPPPIPADLLAEIESYNQDRKAYIESINEILRIAGDTVPRPQRDATPQETVAHYRQYLIERRAAQRRALDSYQRETEPRFNSLVARMTAIRSLLTALAETMKDSKTGQPLDADALLAAYRASLREFDAFGREETIYRTYRTAMLLPGLSPEQRRLLFGAALVGLAQSLPPGEPLPRSSLPRPSH